MEQQYFLAFYEQTIFPTGSFMLNIFFTKKPGPHPPEPKSPPLRSWNHGFYELSDSSLEVVSIFIFICWLILV